MPQTRRTKFVPDYFSHQLCDIDTLPRNGHAVTKITWFKQPPSSEDEFLMAQVERARATVYLLVERAHALDAKWKQVVSTSSPSLSLGDVDALVVALS